MKKVLFAGFECAPFVKAGGLGDVLGSLPKALSKKGIDARVVLPFYSSISEDLTKKFKLKCSVNVPVGWKNSMCDVYEGKLGGVTHYLLKNDTYFSRGSIYGEFDDAERVAFFSKAALEILSHINFYPDVFNVNDWHTALIPVYLNVFYRDIKGYENIKTVLSIHNVEFQGKYDPLILGDVFGLDISHKAVLMYDGCINVLKGGIESADRINTVSETYAKEILTKQFSYGLDGILNPRSYKLNGIVNGIDINLYNPETDKALQYNYGSDNLLNKTLNKKAFQKEMELPVDKDIPMIGMVTRLTTQKGLSLIKDMLKELSELPAQFVLIGTGYTEYENMMRFWEWDNRDKVRSIIAFSQSMAAKIYAASDMFLMPSLVEPCGLAQMIAMRYGAVPIVHMVGGLADTVEAFNPEAKTGNGITFQSYNGHDMLDAIKRAIELYGNKAVWKILRKNAMETDFSWDKSADKYIEMYGFAEA